MLVLIRALVALLRVSYRVLWLLLVLLLVLWVLLRGYPGEDSPIGRRPALLTFIDSSQAERVAFLRWQEELSLALRVKEAIALVVVDHKDDHQHKSSICCCCS